MYGYSYLFEKIKINKRCRSCLNEATSLTAGSLLTAPEFLVSLIGITWELWNSLGPAVKQASSSTCCWLHWLTVIFYFYFFPINLFHNGSGLLCVPSAVPLLPSLNVYPYDNRVQTVVFVDLIHVGDSRFERHALTQYL